MRSCPRPTLRRALVATLTLSAIGLAAAAPSAASAADAWADSIVSFDPGDLPAPGPDPSVTLGPPERFTGEGCCPNVVSPFSPAFLPDEIISIGPGGSLVIAFDEPVVDDPANPFGVDLIVFGNTGFIDSSFPANKGIVGGMFGNDGGVIEVSADGVVWVTVANVEADGLFPSIGYLDSGPFDDVPGAIESDFTRPVNPALTFDDLFDLDYAALLDVYEGSGGGAGVDLAATGLSEISFVRVSNPIEASTPFEVDAFSDVAASGGGQPGDANGDGVVDFADLLDLLSTWGPCPGCGADFDGDGFVDFDDLVTLLSNWS